MDVEKLISENVNNPAELEKLYREHPMQFMSSFNSVFAANPESIILKVWNERLHFTPPEKETIDRKKWGDIFLAIILILSAGTLARLPVFIKSIKPEFFYPREGAFLVFLPIAVYFIFKNRPSKKIILSVAALFLVSLIYINILPERKSYIFYSDSLILAMLHLPFFLWSLVGLSFMGGNFRDMSKRIDYLRFNGEVLIYVPILLISSILLITLTTALFSLIDIDIWKLKSLREYVPVYGFFAVLFVATYLVDMAGRAARNLASSVAKVFSPVVLIVLVIYLLTMVASRKSPYIDREVLLVFNVMLLIVLAITIVTISERTPSNSSRMAGDYINFSLVLVTLIIDLIALSAILFRITSYGFTPNRTAVLGANILAFINLAGVITNYFRFFQKKSDVSSVEIWIVRYLPVYVIWTAVVAFGFPLIFFFR